MGLGFRALVLDVVGALMRLGSLGLWELRFWAGMGFRALVFRIEGLPFSHA